MILADVIPNLEMLVGHNEPSWMHELRGMVDEAPRYLPGQIVWYELRASVAGVSITKWVEVYVLGVEMLEQPSNTKMVRTYIYKIKIAKGSVSVLTRVSEHDLFTKPQQ